MSEPTTPRDNPSSIEDEIRQHAENDREQSTGASNEAADDLREHSEEPAEG